MKNSDPSLAGQPAHVVLPKLLKAHGGRLYGVALKLCGHPDDAEELVQEIFLIALRKWHQFQGDASPTTWLYTIAARACTRRRRRRSGEPRTIDSFSDLLPTGEARIPDLAVLTTPLDDQMQRETREVVERAIAELPIHFRMPLVLKEIVELPIADVAAILGLKEATVKTRVHRGRLALRRELARTVPRREAPSPDHSRQMCLDLLKAKQESLDRGVPFRVPAQELCTRCQAMFASLDLTQEICHTLGRDEIPATLQKALMKAFNENI